MIQENVSLKKYNTYGIGGNTRYMIEPSSTEELKEILNKLNNNGVKWFLLGGGSNVILPDEDYDGAIIRLTKMNDIKFLGDTVYASAGITLGVFIQKMLSKGFVNFAELMGIPGTVGGALMGNAGANGKEIYDDLISVDVMDNFGEVTTIMKDDINYGYRNTEFKNSNKIIVGACFKSRRGNVSAAEERIKINLENRKNKQPLEFKNAGSVFKNPEGMVAGKLIEEAGLKGYRIGDAMVSLKHANFIVNLGNATSRDIIELIEYIKEEVKKNSNVELELEQIIVKW